jgi:hypothetical protein
MPELTRRRSPDSRKMPLTRGGTAGYDARRMTFEFTMIDGRAQVVGCEISSTAMDELASS